jgi:hypothetical protein
MQSSCGVGRSTRAHMIPPLSGAGSPSFDRGRPEDSTGCRVCALSSGMARGCGEGNCPQTDRDAAKDGGEWPTLIDRVDRANPVFIGATTCLHRANRVFQWCPPASAPRLAASLERCRQRLGEATTFQLEQSIALSIMARLRGRAFTAAHLHTLPSSRGPGHSPLKAVTPVRIRLGAPFPRKSQPRKPG